MEQIIKTEDLVFDYPAQTPEESDVRVLKSVNFTVKKGILLQFWDITVPENPLLPSILTLC